REVEVEESGTVNAVSAGIADKIRATTWDSLERYALRRYFRSRHGQREAIVVDVAHEDSPRIAFEVVTDRIASLNAVRNRECIGAGILHTQRIAPNERRRRNPTVQLNDSTQFPSAQHRGSGTVERLGRRYLPDAVDRCTMPGVKI